jgi:hypothetical protein
MARCTIVRHVNSISLSPRRAKAPRTGRVWLASPQPSDQLIYGRCAPPHYHGGSILGERQGVREAATAQVGHRMFRRFEYCRLVEPVDRHELG